MITTAKKQIRWVNLIFFIVTAVAGLAGAPLYIHAHGLRASDTALFLTFLIGSGLAITMGYHRLFAHQSYKAHPVIQFIYLFFGAAAFEQSAYKWASQHRDHHLYIDTERDPYNSKKGFWYSHIGWLIFWKQASNFGNVHDLEKNKMLMHQHKYYALWSITAGIVIPVLIGALFGRAGAALILAVCFRIAFVHHSTFCINSFCHFLGTRTYDLMTSARDHWFVALLTFGEGYHNFHHRFPSDFRNGIRWYHWDPTKWMISILSLAGLTRELRVVADSRIISARITADRALAHRRLAQGLAPAVHHVEIKRLLEEKYAQLQEGLGKIQKASEDYWAVTKQNKAARQKDFKELKRAALASLRLARMHFRQKYENWGYLLRSLNQTQTPPLWQGRCAMAALIMSGSVMCILLRYI